MLVSGKVNAVMLAVDKVQEAEAKLVEREIAVGMFKWQQLMLSLPSSPCVPLASEWALPAEGRLPGSQKHSNSLGTCLPRTCLADDVEASRM